MAKRKKKLPVPAAPAETDWKGSFEEATLTIRNLHAKCSSSDQTLRGAVETIEKLRDRISLIQAGYGITKARAAAYHAGLAAKGVTPEDQRCCTLLDGILGPVMAAVEGWLKIIPSKPAGAAASASVVNARLREE